MKKTITVYSDDPKTPQLVLTLSGETWIDVEAQPARIHFGEMQPGADGTKPLELKVTEPNEVKLGKIESQDPRFSVEPSEDGDQGRKKYTVTFAGEKQVGAIETRLVVNYTGPDGEAHIDVPIICQIVGDLRYPRSVFFSKVGDAYPPQKVAIGSRSNKAVRILSGKDPEGRVEVKVLEPLHNQARVELTVGDTTGAKASRGKVELRTSDPTEPIVTIPYNLQLIYRRPTGSRSTSQRLKSR